MENLKKYLRLVKWYFPYKNNIKNSFVNVLDFENTVNMIISKKLSVSRFGDGEFRFLLSEDNGNTFEINSSKLSKKLKSVLKSNHKNLLICIPNVYDGLNSLKLDDKIFWQREISIYFKKYSKYLDENYLYGDSFFTRPYQGYKMIDKLSAKKFSMIKKIWDKRNILMVEGRLTRFGVGNDLLSNASSIRRIIAPEKNAFEKIDEIYSAVTSEINEGFNEDTLILISLGPTATILSTEISDNLSLQSIDIGHLDIEYEWFLRKATKKIPIKGKYVNESLTEKYISSEIDQKYLSEIVCEIK